MTSRLHEPFAHDWQVRILSSPPLIAPARQFVYPQQIAGEEDTLARGALLLNIQPAAAPNFLATCALGFRDASLPSAVWSCPRAADLLALAGGYAYLIDTEDPSHSLHVPLKPATAILPAPEDGVLLLAGFHHVIALDATGIRFTTARLSWEGVTLIEIHNGELHGTGWNLDTDRDVPFTVDLRTGAHSGGGFTR